jgi:NAD(P)H-hydrate epimerase
MTKLPNELYRAAQVRELDRIAIQDHNIPGYTLMSRAGAATFRMLRQTWPNAQRIVVVCGAGNNAGDGFVIARLAHEAGLTMSVLNLAAPEKLGGDALTAYQAAHAAGVSMAPFQWQSLADADVIVDAILGTGLEREVTGVWWEAIKAINKQKTPVLAVDIPSGLNADSGTVMGIAVQADVTMTFIALKQGLFTGQGPSYCGMIEFADLQVPDEVYRAIHPASRRYEGEDLPRLLAPRPRAAHKGRHGHVLVVGGDLGMAGAPRMAGEAAARCGAGLISIATRAAHAGFQSAVRPELMFRGVENLSELGLLMARASVVAIGPGLGRGEWGQSMLEFVLASDCPLVVDADGLNLLASNPVRRDNWILTPHPGEAARLLKMTSAEVEADRFTAVSDLAVRFGGVCVLKGSGSLIASEEAGIFLSTSGNPGMATGGMGDLLTGVIASLLAQGLTPIEAARAGVYLHGKAGDKAAAKGERGLMAMDLMVFLRDLVNPIQS